ncbi:Rolling stone [Caligus rogercresseyi]|uniref:Rolling stone n=1 Tax=Caligus rogercresseyi TaxID=217165 RepID=A0A7T8HFQ8_CALRO|nr:Rolling stone [Caligus rogercresseyi]
MEEEVKGVEEGEEKRSPKDDADCEARMVAVVQDWINEGIADDLIALVGQAETRSSCSPVDETKKQVPDPEEDREVEVKDPPWPITDEEVGQDGDCVDSMHEEVESHGCIGFEHVAFEHICRETKSILKIRTPHKIM